MRHKEALPPAYEEETNQGGEVNELHLFAGAGGGILAGHQLGHTIVGAVEWEPYCQKLLQARQQDGTLPPFPIWGDVRTFDGRPWCGCVDIICAGFPCQPFSIAGDQRAGEDPRNGWPATVRIIREVRPEWVLLENVSGLLARSHGYMHTILGQLAESGYDCRWDCISANSCGAPHERDRLWIVAHSNSNRGKTRVSEQNKRKEGEPNLTLHRRHQQSGWKGGDRWPPEPRVDRVVNGLAYRVDRLKALGNGQVPSVAVKAWRLLR